MGQKVHGLVIWYSPEINLSDKNEETPIFHACKYKKMGAIECLYELGANITGKNITGNTPMGVSAYHGNIEAMHWLNDKGISIIDEKVYNGCSLMFPAAMGGQVGAMEWLKEQGLSENDKSDDDRTPMFIAAYSCQINAMAWLKEQGAKVNFRNSNGWTAMRDAAISGQLKAMQWLKEQGADVINDKTNDGDTHMHTAAQCGHIDIMYWLKEQNVSVKSKNKEGQTPIFRAALGGHVNAMQWLQEQGAEVDIQDNAGRTPESLASEAGHSETVQWLKEQKTGIGKSVPVPTEIRSSDPFENSHIENNNATPLHNAKKASVGVACYHHLSQQAVAQCLKCGKNLCKDCFDVYGVINGEYAGKALCFDCTSQLISQNIDEVRKLKKKTQIIKLLAELGLVPMRAIGQCINGCEILAHGNPAGAVPAFSGMFRFMVFPFVAIHRIIVLRQQMKQANQIVAHDELALQSMQDYFKYTQSIENYSEIDLTSLTAKDGRLFDNVYAQSVLKNGEKAAQEELRRNVEMVSENNAILRNLNEMEKAGKVSGAVKNAG